MKKLDFESFYEKINNSENKEKVDNAVKEMKRLRKVGNIIAIVLILIVDTFMLLFLSRGMYKLISLPYILVIDLVIYCVISAFTESGKAREQNTFYKENVINELIKNFFDNVDYIPLKKMPENIYREGEFEQFYDEYHSDDYFEGKIDDKYLVKMAEVHTIDVEQERQEDGTIEEHRTTIFHGLFAKISMNKSLTTKLRIRPNGFFKTKKNVEMDSREFEKIFDVVSDNKIITMQILTPDIMENLIELYKLLGEELEIYINNDNMYLRIHNGTCFEMTSFKKGALDKDMIEKNFRLLEGVTLLAKEMIDTIEEVEI